MVILLTIITYLAVGVVISLPMIMEFPGVYQLREILAQNPAIKPEQLDEFSDFQLKFYVYGRFATQIIIWPYVYYHVVFLNKNQDDEE